LPDFPILFAIVAVAGLIQGTTGFGFGLFSMGILIMLLPVADAVTIVAVLSLGSIAVNLIMVRRHLSWSDTWPILVTAMPTTALGVLSLQVLDMAPIRVLLAVMIIAGCAVALWSPNRALIHSDRPWAYVAGALSGFVGGAVNSGGPPIVIYTLARNWDKSRVKSVLSLYFAITALFRVAMLGATGVATAHNLTLGLILMLPAMASSYVGSLLFRRLSAPAFRYATMALLVGLAVRIVVT